MSSVEPGIGPRAALLDAAFLVWTRAFGARAFAFDLILRRLLIPCTPSWLILSPAPQWPAPAGAASPPSRPDVPRIGTCRSPGRARWHRTRPARLNAGAGPATYDC